MCMPAPKMPTPPPQLPPPPAPMPPPPSATAATVKQAGAETQKTPGKQRSKNPLRTDKGGADSVASGLNIPV